MKLTARRLSICIPTIRCVTWSIDGENKINNTIYDQKQISSRKMARKTKCRKNFGLAKTTKKSRSQKVNGKPKTVPKIQTPKSQATKKPRTPRAENSAKTSRASRAPRTTRTQANTQRQRQQPTSRQNGSTSPSIFQSHLLLTYTELQYINLVSVILEDDSIPVLKDSHQASKEDSVQMATDSSQLKESEVIPETIRDSTDQSIDIFSAMKDDFEVDKFQPLIDGSNQMEDSNKRFDSNGIDENIEKAKPDQSEDLFATESTAKNVVEYISTGTQVSGLIETHEIAISTDYSTSDVGVQTSPNPYSCGCRHESGSLYYDRGSYEDNYMDDYSSEYSSDNSSTDSLADFDMLEDLDHRSVDVQTCAQPVGDANGLSDETNSTVSASPPRNQVYSNRKFHSPESVAIIEMVQETTEESTASNSSKQS